MKKKYIFCFDIDNVICKTINKNYKTSKPNKKSIKKIRLCINKKLHISNEGNAVHAINVDRRKTG